MSTQPQKRIKTAKPNLKPVQVPMCPRHNRPMRFDKLNNRWACAEEGCTIVSYPKNDFDTKRPTILTAETHSELELVLYQKDQSPDGKDHIYVRHVKTGVLIEITTIVTSDGWILENPSPVSAPIVRLNLITRNFAWY